jgi:hypothetical protein
MPKVKRVLLFDNEYCFNLKQRKANLEILLEKEPKDKKRRRIVLFD